MNWTCLAWAGVVWVVASLPAVAQDRTAAEQDAQARAAFQSARVAMDDGRFEAALTLFEEAYRLSNRPELLFNAALAHDRMRHDAQAEDAYRRYLAERPDAPNRAEVERRIEFLQGGREGEPEPDSGPGAWPWVLLGGGAALVAGGTVMLVMGQGNVSDVENAMEGTPWPDIEDEASSGPTLSVAGVILLAVGGASAAGGLVLALAAGSSGDDASVSLGPTGLSVQGRF